MKNLIVLGVIVTCFMTTETYSQNRYIRLVTLQTGIEDRMKVVFAMPDTPDSAKYYTSLKIGDMILGIELMEKNGYELVNISTASHSFSMSALLVTTAYMRRRLR